MGDPLEIDIPDKSRLERIQCGREWAALAPWLTNTELLFDWWQVPMPVPGGHFRATQLRLLKPGRECGRWRIAGCGKTGPNSSCSN